MRLRIFVSGPISSRNPVQYILNLYRGIRTEAKLVAMGYAPLGVFCNFMWHWVERGITRDDYYDTDLAWIGSADAVLAIPGWWGSHGAKREIEVAEDMGIPVFYSLTALREWGARQ